MAKAAPFQTSQFTFTIIYNWTGNLPQSHTAAACLSSKNTSTGEERPAGYPDRMMREMFGRSSGGQAGRQAGRRRGHLVISFVINCQQMFPRHSSPNYPAESFGLGSFLFDYTHTVHGYSDAYWKISMSTQPVDYS